MSFSYEKDVVFHISGDDKTAFFMPADSKTFTLSDREKLSSLMLSDYFPSVFL
jgi:hypothetical protein